MLPYIVAGLRILIVDETNDFLTGIQSHDNSLTPSISIWFEGPPKDLSEFSDVFSMRLHSPLSCHALYRKHNQYNIDVKIEIATALTAYYDGV